MTRLKRILVALAVLLALAAALPFFISLDDYIPRIENEVSARLKEPVSIKDIKFAALPLPHVTIEGITIGKTDDIKLGSVTLTPDLFSMLQSTRVIKTIEIDSLSLTRTAIDKISALAKSEAAKPPQPSTVRIENIHLENVLVKLDKADFGPFDARLRLDGKGALGDAEITTQDGKLKVLIKPDKSDYLIDVSAKAWTLPIGPPLVFDELIIKGMATQSGARMDDVSARLYGGTLAGKVNIGWQKGMQIDGHLDVNQLEVQQIASLLSPGARISGKLSAKPAFSASAAAADHLMQTLRLETSFSVRDGILHGVDIQKAATHLIKQGTSGGETRFEHLSGHLVVAQGSHHFTQLNIASGALAAEGSVSVSPNKELSGRINAQVKAVGTSTKVPLNVSGTVSAPLLYPSAGTLAGAAIGTAIMGPGVGTSVGAKVGGWAEGLFDAKPLKAPK
jgi:uncharacterized protein involved in outer membrane biogenesis